MTDTNYQQVSNLLVEEDDVDTMSVERSIRQMRLLNPLVRVVDGIQALDVLRRGEVTKPYIILLDLNLPRMGGLEFLATIRDEEQLRDTVVFVLTTSKNEEEIYAAYKNTLPAISLNRH